MSLSSEWYISSCWAGGSMRSQKGGAAAMALVNAWLHSFSMASGTNYHELCALEERPFIIL